MRALAESGGQRYGRSDIVNGRSQALGRSRLGMGMQQIAFQEERQTDVRRAGSTQSIPQSRIKRRASESRACVKTAAAEEAKGIRLAELRAKEK